MKSRTTMAIGAACALTALPSVMQADVPCSKCGPGDHWIDSCPGTTAGGHDVIPTSVVEVGFHLGSDCPTPSALTRVVFSGGFTVARSWPHDDSGRFCDCPDGTCEGGECVGGSHDGQPCITDGHCNVIDAEIIEMVLTGPDGMTLTAGAGLGHVGQLPQSLGSILENSPDASVGAASFKVFFEIDDGMDDPNYYYNHAPFIVKADITCVPPAVALQADDSCVALYDTPVAMGRAMQNGTVIAPTTDYTPYHHFFTPEPEACCLPDGSCEFWNALACESVGGEPQGAGSQCGGLQACCGEILAPEHFECYIADATCCIANAHTPQGNGTLCSPALEACCLNDGTCQMLDPLCCVDQGGAPQGPETQCLGTEACCFSDGTCAEMDALCCLNEGGLPQGPGSQCGGTQACCLPDGTCVMADALCCVNELGGEPQSATEVFTSVELDAELDCAHSCCPGEARFLPAGLWEVVVADNPNDHFDAASLWSSDFGCAPPDGSGLCWLWRMMITTPDEVIDWRPTVVPGYYATQQEALAANIGRSTTFFLDEPATVYFWFIDSPCSDNRGGVTVDVRRSSPGSCTTPEACCFGDDTCQMLDPRCCLDQGGTPQGTGSACLGVEACCDGIGFCYMADAACCLADGGTPQGPGTVCTVSEACCFPDDTCQMLDPLCCAGQGGTPQGSASACGGPAAHEWMTSDLSWSPGAVSPIFGWIFRFGTEWFQFTFSDIDINLIDKYVTVEFYFSVTNRASGERGLDGLIEVVINPESDQPTTYPYVLLDNVDPSNFVRAYDDSAGSWATHGEIKVPKSYINDGQLIVRVNRHPDHGIVVDPHVGTEQPIQMSTLPPTVPPDVYLGEDAFTAHIGVNTDVNGGTAVNCATGKYCVAVVSDLREEEACCLPNGTCEMADALCCVNELGGVPQGPGSVCTAREACCLSGTCAMLDPLCCLNQSGVPQGTGTLCGVCGSCCLENKACLDDTVDGRCAAVGGSFEGGGSICAGDADGDGIDDLCDNCPGVDDAIFGTFVCDSGLVCETDADCPPGETCKKACVDEIPAVSEWGLVVLTLLLITVGKIYFGRRQLAAG